MNTMYYPYLPMEGWGVIGGLLWVFLVVLVIVSLIRGSRGRRWDQTHHHYHDRSSPLDILRERYAKGELTKDQFEAMRRDIEI